MAKKYYWFKMPKGYYGRHDIKMIKRRLGTEALHCYNKVILESIDHEGMLRFSEDIPYTTQTLAEAIDAEYELFDKLFDLLKEHKMIEVLDDGTVCVPFVLGRIGSESEGAERVREYRKKQKPLQCNNIVQECNTEIEIEIEKDKKIFIENSSEFQLSLLLQSLILKNNPNARKQNIQTWAGHIDKMIRLDKRTHEQIEQIIKFSQTDPFWQSNILSTKKLREKFDTLWLQKDGKKNQNKKVLGQFKERDIKESDIEDLYFDPFKELKKEET